MCAQQSGAGHAPHSFALSHPDESEAGGVRQNLSGDTAVTAGQDRADRKSAPAGPVRCPAGDGPSAMCPEAFSAAVLPLPLPGLPGVPGPGLVASGWCFISCVRVRSLTGV
ncbi:hypothetical protein GCM10025784_08970 [Citricoccus nitrophenolicus]